MIGKDPEAGRRQNLPYRLSMHFLNEQNIFLFLIQIFLLLGSAKLLGELFRRWKQPPMTAEILIGVLFGPTVLGRCLPGLHRLIFPADVIQQNMLETVAWLGILFLLLETGLEVDFTSAWRQKGDALKIAVTDIVVPMAIAFVPALLLPDRYLIDPEKRIIFAVFMATVMTISAMPVTARVLHDLRLNKTDLGFLIMTALSVNDIIGWMFFTVVIATFTQASFSGSVVLSLFLLTCGFTIICLTLGKRFANTVISRIQVYKLPEPASSFTFICLLGFFCGAMTQRIGIHALFGFFLAGIMAGGSHSLPERTRQIIAQMVYALFVPLFFINIGLKVDFLKYFDPFLVFLLCLLGITGRFLGAWFGVRFTRQEKSNRLPIAIAHIPGGVMEIVISLLALEYRLITESVFVAIAFSAVFSSVILGPWLADSIRKRRKVSILEFFSRRAVVSDLATDSRDEAIRKLSEVVYEQEEVTDAETIFAAVVRREREMGTALEEGIAVPHARLPFMKKPVIVFGRSVSGIDWNSPDGKLSRFIFLILTPAEEDVQVQILSLICKAFGNRDVREDLLKAQSHHEVWEALQKAFSADSVIKKS